MPASILISQLGHANVVPCCVELPDLRQAEYARERIAWAKAVCSETSELLQMMARVADVQKLDSSEFLQNIIRACIVYATHEVRYFARSSQELCTLVSDHSTVM